MLSGHNASFIPDILWVGLALFYGGLVQLLAGMWEFRNRNVFGSTAFSTWTRKPRFFLSHMRSLRTELIIRSMG